MTPPDCTIAAVLAKSPSAQAYFFEVGEQVGNPLFTGEAPPQPLAPKTLLVIAVLAMVFVLGLVVVRSVKNIESIQGGGSDE